MRSYGQYCAAACTLDVVGDRWSLLIVRELFVRECRFRDLLEGLPGIATNLLTERLRTLEGGGVLERVDVGGASARYRLTARGRGLSPVLREMLIWGIPLMGDPAAFAWRDWWLATAVALLLADVPTEALAPMRALLCAADDAVLVIVDPGHPIAVELDGRALSASATVRVEADVRPLLEYLLGRPGDVQVDGDEKPLTALIHRIASDIGR